MMRDTVVGRWLSESGLTSTGMAAFGCGLPDSTASAASDPVVCIIFQVCLEFSGVK